MQETCKKRNWPRKSDTTGMPEPKMGIFYYWQTIDARLDCSFPPPPPGHKRSPFSFQFFSVNRMCVCNSKHTAKIGGGGGGRKNRSASRRRPFFSTSGKRVSDPISTFNGSFSWRGDLLTVPSRKKTGAKCWAVT